MAFYNKTKKTTGILGLIILALVFNTKALAQGSDDPVAIPEPSEATGLGTPPKEMAAGNKHSGGDGIYRTVEQMPEFPGGQAAMMEYLKKNIRYPASARENDIEGRVYIRFIVDENGSVISPSVIRGFDKDCEAEAIRVIAAMPKWKPGMQSGKKVKTYFTLPVTFKLQ